MEFCFKLSTNSGAFIKLSSNSGCVTLAVVLSCCVSGGCFRKAGTFQPLAVALSDGEQQWGFGRTASVCFDLDRALEFGSVWRRRSGGLFPVWSDWAAIEWHNCLPVPGGGWLAFCSCQTGPPLRRLTGKNIPPMQLHLANLLLFTKNKNYHSSTSCLTMSPLMI